MDRERERVQRISRRTGIVVLITVAAVVAVVGGLFIWLLLRMTG